MVDLALVGYIGLAIVTPGVASWSREPISRHGPSTTCVRSTIRCDRPCALDKHRKLGTRSVCNEQTQRFLWRTLRLLFHDVRSVMRVSPRPLQDAGASSAAPRSCKDPSIKVKRAINFASNNMRTSINAPFSSCDSLAPITCECRKRARNAAHMSPPPSAELPLPGKHLTSTIKRHLPPHAAPACCPPPAPAARLSGMLCEQEPPTLAASPPAARPPHKVTADRRSTPPTERACTAHCTCHNHDVGLGQEQGSWEQFATEVG